MLCLLGFLLFRLIHLGGETLSNRLQSTAKASVWFVVSCSLIHQSGTRVKRARSLDADIELNCIVLFWHDARGFITLVRSSALSFGYRSTRIQPPRTTIPFSWNMFPFAHETFFFATWPVLSSFDLKSLED